MDKLTVIAYILKVTVLTVVPLIIINAGGYIKLNSYEKRKNTYPIQNNQLLYLSTWNLFS
ncbi:MAG: hypothetical protein JXJ22_02745 [Bacteroidales bacterium]|nr:hypothetical protein [Bacteroidales bacterium]